MIEIRSYAPVFALERRIYRIDRLRLNPAGVPVRGVVYFLVLLAAAGLAGVLPLAGSAVALVPWYVRDLALPLGGAAIAGSMRPDGRTFHLAALSLVRFGMAPRQLAGVRARADWERRWRPPEIVFLPAGGVAPAGAPEPSCARRRQVIVLGNGASVAARSQRPA